MPPVPAAARAGKVSAPAWSQRNKLAPDVDVSCVSDRTVTLAVYVFGLKAGCEVSDQSAGGVISPA